MAAKKQEKPAEDALPVLLRVDMVEDEKIVALIGGLARAGSDLEEIAAVLKVKPDDLRAFLIMNPRSFQAFAAGPAAGRAELRAAQHKFAKEGDSRLLVWLGRQRLGQSDDAPASGDIPADPGARDWDELSTWRMPKH